MRTHVIFNVFHKKGGWTTLFLFIAAFFLLFPAPEAHAKKSTSEKLAASVEMSFHDAPAHAVLLALSEVFELNLAMSPGDLSSNVTLNIRGRSLSNVLDNLSVLADFEWNIEDDTIVVVQSSKVKPISDVRVSHSFMYRNASDMVERATELVGRIVPEKVVTVDEGANSITVSTPPKHAREVLSILESMDMRVPGVFVDVVFLETRADDNESGGFAWAWKELTTTISESPSSGGFFAGGQLVRKSLDITTQISSAVSDGSAKVLNSTRILVESGAEATLHSGENTPVITNNPETGPKTEYKDTGVRLTVKPVVRGNGDIYMKMIPSFSEVTGMVKTQMTEAPVTSERTVSTEAVLANGEWFVIGGLIRDRKTSSESGIPLLKDLPLLGTLFKSATSSSSRTQTVILIRPSSSVRPAGGVDWAKATAPYMASVRETRTSSDEVFPTRTTEAEVASFRAPLDERVETKRENEGRKKTFEELVSMYGLDKEEAK